MTVRFLALATLLLLVPLAVAANDWGQFRYDETHPGAVPAALNKEFIPFKQRWWNNATLPPNPGSPSVRGALVFIGDSVGNVHAFDQESGGLVWSNVTSSGARISAPPAVGQDLVYVLTENGAIYMFDRKTGAQRGSPVGGGETLGAILLHETGGLLMVASGPTITAYNLGQKGVLQAQPKWSFSVAGVFFNNTADCSASPNAIQGTPVLYGNQVFFGSQNKCFFSIDKSSVGPISAPTWVAKAKDSIRSTPAIDQSNKKVIFGDQSGNVYILALDGTGTVTATPAFTEPGGAGSSEIVVAAAIAENKIIIGSRNGKLRALAATSSSTTTSQWDRDLGGQILGSPAVANGYVIAPSFSRQLFFLKVSDGTNAQDPVPATDILETSPAISGTQAFWTAIDGSLYSYGGEKPPRADLKVENLAASLTATQPGTVTAAIRNVGALPASSSKISLFAGANLVAEGAAPALDVGASYAFSGSFTPSLAGALQVRLFVDSLRAVPESDESNNQVTITAIVAAAPVVDPGGGGGGNGEEEEGVPGFGLPLVLVVLGLLAFARRRRGLNR